MVADVRQAIPAFVAHRQSPDEALTDALIASGRSRAEAERLLIFMPIAFARVLLNDLGVMFPGTYKLQTPSGELVSRRFMAQPVFYAATAVAKMGHDRDTFLAVAGRSAEFKVVNQALNDGSKPKHLLLSEPILSLPNDEPEVASNAPKSEHPPDEPQRKGWLGRLLGR